MRQSWCDSLTDGLDLPVIHGVVGGQVVQDEDMAPLSAGLTGAVEESLKVFVKIISTKTTRCYLFIHQGDIIFMQFSQRDCSCLPDVGCPHH